MKERYEEQMSAYINKIKRCEVSEATKLHLIDQLITRKRNRIEEILVNPDNIYNHMEYISRQCIDIEVLKELENDVLDVKDSKYNQ